MVILSLAVWAMAITLSLLEPTVQAVSFFFHEKAWEKKDKADQENIPRLISFRCSFVKKPPSRWFFYDLHHVLLLEQLTF